MLKQSTTRLKRTCCFVPTKINKIVQQTTLCPLQLQTQHFSLCQLIFPTAICRVHWLRWLVFGRRARKMEGGGYILSKWRKIVRIEGFFLLFCLVNEKGVYKSIILFGIEMEGGRKSKIMLIN